MKNPTEIALANTCFATRLAKSLAAKGLRDVVVSPGSRSTPLVLAFVRQGGFRIIPVLDERSAAFLALGLARSTGRVVALICTSGSAVANWFPAVVEAHESRVPLLLMTADRPPELRGCGAGQTIDQEKFYGRYVRTYREYPLPDECDGNDWEDFLSEDWSLVQGACPGPGQLNFPFREPLLPPDEKGILPSGEGPKVEEPAAPSEELPLPTLPDRWKGAPRTLLISGPWLGPEEERWTQWLKNLSVEQGWPVLADALSPLRHQHNDEKFTPVGHYDMLLRDQERAANLRPDRIIQLGALPTSKVLRQLLDQWQTPRLIVDPYALNPHPDNAPVEWLGRPDAEGKQINLPPASEEGHAWRDQWQEMDREVREWILAGKQQSGSFEGSLYPLLAENLPARSVLHIASSTPVRDAEWFWPANGKYFKVYSSRGANGIDGTLSTAIGEALGENQPLWLITGDLALLHDANGILQHQQAGLSLTILLINNEGGGIFQNLPISRYGKTFETFFATPQQIDWETWAKAFGVAHTLLRSRDDLAAQAASPATAGVRILEWRTDRRRDAEIRRRWLRAFSP